MNTSTTNNSNANTAKKVIGALESYAGGVGYVWSSAIDDTVRHAADKRYVCAAIDVLWLVAVCPEWAWLLGLFQTKRYDYAKVMERAAERNGNAKRPWYKRAKVMLGVGIATLAATVVSCLASSGDGE